MRGAFAGSFLPPRTEMPDPLTRDDALPGGVGGVSRAFSGSKPVSISWTRCEGKSARRSDPAQFDDRPSTADMLREKQRRLSNGSISNQASQWQRRSKHTELEFQAIFGDEEPIGVQQATPSQLDRRLRDVEPEELIRRPAPEKWSIAEIAAHLADAELAMGWRLRNMPANPGVALTWWDEAAWAERLGYAQQDASLSAGVFRALRESNLRLLESVRLEAAHDLNHLRRIDRIPGGCM
jgi:hypothetical protein